MRTDEQHPQMQTTFGTVWQAHCCQCGTYVEDSTSPPPVDYLCDDCQETT